MTRTEQTVLKERLNAYERFWLDDLEPLGGRLRFVFYAGLLILAVTANNFRTPLEAPLVFAVTDPDIYTPMGLFSATGVAWASPAVLLFVRNITLVSWICAAIGLFSRWSLLVTGVGFFILHGITTGAVGVTHRWYLVMYSLLALSLAVRDSRWSVDYHLAKRFTWFPKPAGHGLGNTGFARKLILLFAVFTLFSGAVSKMICSGIEWMDGRSIQFQIASIPRPHLSELSQFLQTHLWACSALSVGTIILEFGSIWALFSRVARHIVVIAACIFHVGIYCVMEPVYWYQMWCYILLVDWGRMVARLKGRPYSSDQEHASLQQSCGPDLGTFGRRAALWLASGVSVLLFIVMTIQIEWWPLSHIPMYSEYAGDYSSRLKDEEQAIRYARICYKNHAGTWPRNWYVLYLIDQSGAYVPYSSVLTEQRGFTSGMHAKQLYRTMRATVAEDLVMKSPGSIAFNPSKPDYPASVWLRKLGSEIKRKVPDWQQYKRLVLVCNLESGPVMIASTDLRKP